MRGTVSQLYSRIYLCPLGLKLLLSYLYDNCNHAGIFDVHFPTMCVQLKMNKDDVKTAISELQPLLISDKKNIHVAVWVSAFVFSAIHMQFYGFIPRMLLGGLYGYLLFWSGSLWLPVIAHFVNNGLAVLVYYMRFNGTEMPDPDTLGLGEQWWLAVLSALCVSALLFFLYKIRKEDAP